MAYPSSRQVQDMRSVRHFHESARSQEIRLQQMRHEELLGVLNRIVDQLHQLEQTVKGL